MSSTLLKRSGYVRAEAAAVLGKLHGAWTTLVKCARPDDDLMWGTGPGAPDAADVVVCHSALVAPEGVVARAAVGAHVGHIYRSNVALQGGTAAPLNVSLTCCWSVRAPSARQHRQS